ncbi:MAG: Asp23/Gls24 family envelope stress response protein [Anaerolineae bacterium]|nr:MAG: Asp23/Gls24 family envelope stress response protein [Anaerolineae bacterium]
MENSPRPPGKTTVAASVLLSIARLTALQVPGVSRMAPLPPDIARLLRRSNASQGVVLKIEDDRIYADLYVVLKSGLNIREVSRQIQHEVKRAFSEMIGMEVGRINVHIEDIDYPPNDENNASDENPA